MMMMMMMITTTTIIIIIIVIIVTLEGVDHLDGLVVKASASIAEGPGFESRLRRDFFRGRVIPVTQTLALQWLP